MEKYEKKLIIDYINGNDIEEYNIEDLENDLEFMIQVIKESNDKKMYNFCSDSLKKDYRLVKFLIDKYNNDLKYICNVADYFLETVEDDFERTELSIIMSNLTRNKSNITKYNVISNTIYSGKRLQVELYKLKNNEDDFANELGMGFLLIYDLYNTSNIVLDFYAKKIIEDIFNEYDIELEKLLHTKFKTSEEINIKGINNYMISFIEIYDPMLASYASSHLEVLLPFKKMIIEIQKNWDNYNKTKEFNIYTTMLEEIHKYMEEYEYKSNYTETEYLYYTALKLGINEKIKRYDNLNDDIYNDLINSFNGYMDENNLDFTDMIHIKKIKEIMINCLNEKFQEDDYLVNNENKKCKILKINK